MKFYWADAGIEGDEIIVSSPSKIPVAVRYAWADNPICIYTTVPDYLHYPSEQIVGEELLNN